ncbi:MAG: hypothetical protein WDO56_16755 [Gammaproteobacteria bacterium]
MKVFRDKTSLSATPALWGSIEKALGASEYFLLMASPLAAQSPWVQREIDWWLHNRSVDRLLILLTHGELAWDSGARDFDWTRTDAVPELLRGRFSDEPLYVDLRWADHPEKLSLRNTRFRGAILDLSATVRGVPKDDLDGEDVRQHRRTRMLATATIVAILAFGVVAAWQAYVATAQRKIATAQTEIATAQRNTALSRLLASQSLENASGALPHLDLALLQGVAAYRIDPTAEARRSVINALLETNRVKRFVHAPDTLVSLALSPDTKTIATGDSRGHVILWDAETLRVNATLENGTDFVSGLSFSPDGRSLAAVDSGHLVLWSLSNGTATKRHTLAAKARLGNIAWSPDSTTVYSNDIGTRRWDAESGVERAAIGADSRATWRRLVLSPDGRTIATAGDDRSIALWDTASGRLRQTLRGQSPTVTSLAFNGDGSALASGGSDGTIAIWDMARGSVRRVLEKYHAPVDAIVFGPDGTALASGDRDHMVLLWNLATGEPREALPGHTNGVMQLAFTHAGGELISSAFEDTFIVWDLGAPGQRTLLTGHSSPVNNVVVSPDGSTIASASDDGTIRLWDIATARERLVLSGNRGEVRAIAFNPASGVLASGGEDRRIRFWDTRSGQILEEIDAQGEVESLAISPDGKALAWASNGSSPIYLWDIAAREPRTELTGHESNARSLEFSRKGDLLVSTGDSTIRVWDPHTGRQVRQPLEVGTPVKATISPDESRIASSQTEPQSVLVWPLQGDADPIELATQNFSSDHSPAFSPDGKWLAYSSGEAALSVTLTATEKGGMSWKLDMPASVESIAFTRDGKRLVTGHSNGQIGLWDADPEHWPERACEIANRNLSHSEWIDFVGNGLAYEVVCPGLVVPKD